MTVNVNLTFSCLAELHEFLSGVLQKPIASAKEAEKVEVKSPVEGVELCPYDVPPLERAADTPTTRKIVTEADVYNARQEVKELKEKNASNGEIALALTKAQAVEEAHKKYETERHAAKNEKYAAAKAFNKVAEIVKEEALAPTFDDVKNAVLELSRKKGREAAVEVMRKYSIEKVGPSLKETDYRNFISDCKAALA